jgi:Flp pilus assembly protein TadG
MTSGHPWKARGRRGQAAVEFALVLPVLLLLIVGVLEFARAWNLHQTLTDAVREGARRALLAHDTDAGVTAREEADSVYAPIWRYLAQAGYDPQYASMGICNTPSTSCGSTSRPLPESQFKESGSNITVTVSFPYRFWVLPFRAITMKSSLTVRNE